MRIPHGLRAALAGQVSGGATDPYFNSVSLLMYGDGTNGSTTFVDSSSNNFTITPAGNAQISTAQSKFGGASMYFDGNGDYLSVADNADFDFGAADFTIECWYYFSANLSGFQPLTAKNAGGAVRDAWVLQQNRGPGATNRPAFLASSGTVDWNVEIISSVAANLNAWNHIAAVRNGNDFVLYLNGTSVATANSSITISSNSLPLSIAAYSSGSLPYSGYIDDLRITKGVARYTANFTPPTAAFPDA